jgi:hypothetical protein
MIRKSVKRFSEKIMPKKSKKILADKSPDPGVSSFRVLRGLSLMDIAERFFVAAAAASLLLIVATAWLVELS